jgi:hypothetical protein
LQGPWWLGKPARDAVAAELALNAESEAELAHRSNVSGPGNLSLFRAFASRKAEFGRRT